LSLLPAFSARRFRDFEFQAVVMVSSLIFGESKVVTTVERRIGKDLASARMSPFGVRSGLFLPTICLPTVNTRSALNAFQHEQIKQSNRGKVTGQAFILEKVCFVYTFWWIIL